LTGSERNRITNIREIPETTSDKETLFFMDSRPYNKSVIITNVCNGKDQSSHGISGLHQNVQNQNSKLTELEALLQSDLKFVSVLCFTEHRQKG
jgi:hypothetical protein